MKLNSSVRSRTKYHIYILYWLFGLLVVFIIWSMNFSLDQYVRAMGVVMPSSNLHSIQSEDGGVLNELHVSEGQLVEAGDLLLSLKSDRIDAELNEIYMQIKYNEIIRERIQAVINDRPLVYNDDLSKFKEYIDFQYIIYNQRIDSNQEQIAVLNNKLELANNQYQIFKSLFDTGDISLVELQNSKDKVLSVENEINNIKNEFQVRNIDEMNQVQRELLVLNEQYNQIITKLNDTEITSPIVGIVNSIDVKTKGSVISSGERILDISPIDDDIYIEVKIDPLDIGSLKEGLEVSVKFDTFDFPIYGSLSGWLIHLSNDVIDEVDPTGNEKKYYKAYVYLDTAQINDRIDLSKIRHGMGVNVDILTGKRTVLEYITKPILRGFGSALGEK